MPDISPIEGAFVDDRLIGIPSYHYDPVFAQIAARAIEALNPSIIALELPAGLEGELVWAASCWPGPVVSDSGSALFPFVPGDSIFETFRLAKEAGIPVVLIDLASESPTVTPRRKRVAPIAIGSEWAKKAPKLFLETTDAVSANAGRTDLRNLAREAHMAREIAHLLAKGKKVLWVGGMAHWTRLQTRIRTEDFEAPAVGQVQHSTFGRMRLAPSALYRMTGRLPWLVARYTNNQIKYEEHSAVQTLALEACKANPEIDLVLITPGETKDVLGAIESDEPAPAIDVAKMLLYARNLAATSGLRERPDLLELLTSAVGTIGPQYAGRLYALAMNDQSSPPALAHDALEWEVAKGHELYRCGGEVIDSKPWWAARGGLVVSIGEVRRRTHNELYKDLPSAGKGGKTYWGCDPRDEDDYVSFVRYLLRRASFADPDEAKSVPFRSGLRDGIDVRATLRNWTSGSLYVREEQRGRQKFTNGAIDWTNMSEHSDTLTGKSGGGWIDPSQTRVGSCSRSVANIEVLSKEPWAQVNRREFSLISLDLPTSRPKSVRDAETFYDFVIKPLLSLQRTSNDNLYAWLDVMFKFSAGKPFAYYSRYAPSPQIHRVAWKHGVRVVHFPLQRVPAKLLNRHKTFRFFAFTPKQWLEFERRRSTTGGTWSSA